MSRAHRHPKQGGLGDHQIREHSVVSYKLQKFNYIAGGFLLNLRRCNRNAREYRRAQGEILDVAQWMQFLIERCERIVTDVAELRPTLIEIRTRLSCHRCKEKLRSATNNHEPSEEHAEFVRARTWEAQVRFLLACINQLAMYLVEHAWGFSKTERFPECLTKLRSALLRQQRHLGRIASQETEVAFEAQSGECEECGEAVDEQAASVMQ